MNEVGASSASEVSSLAAPVLSSSLVPSSMPTAPSEDSCYTNLLAAGSLEWTQSNLKIFNKSCLKKFLKVQNETTELDHSMNYFL